MELNEAQLYNLSGMNMSEIIDNVENQVRNQVWNQVYNQVRNQVSNEYV